MDHLDDTSILLIDRGELGIGFSTVSDDLLESGEWKSSEELNKTIDKVIKEHNYLRSAYKTLRKIEPEEKYYAYIKAMAQKERNYEELEYALFSLASYKKPEDVPFVKTVLLNNYWDMGTTSFRLIKEYPNNAYLEVLEKFSKHAFYEALCKNRGTFDLSNFFAAIASYKQEKSAQILHPILERISSFQLSGRHFLYKAYNGLCYLG